MRILRILFAAAAATAFFATSGAAEPVKIRLSWVAPLSTVGSIWLEKKDLARHFGKSYVVEAIRFTGTPPMITAIANNELEVSDLAYSTLPIAIQNAGIDDLVVISDEFQDGVPGYYSNEFLVLAEGSIKSVADLKGKVVATNAAGSAVDIASRYMLKKAGLEDKRDYTTVEAPLPTMKAMLMEKKADLIPAVLPFSLDPELRKVSRTLFTGRDAVGITQFSTLNARRSFIRKNRAAMVDFMEDSLRIIRWYLEPANKKQVAEIASRITKQPPERFSWLFTTQDYHRDPNMLPNLEALQNNVKVTKELGFVKADLDVKKYVDLTLLEEAAKRLK
jgi:sulfonate transport system substrate-binding protein